MISHDAASIFSRLTPREVEILELVARGGSAKEVAVELGIAACTVERHIENVRLKTRTRNRAHMVAVVVRHWLAQALAADTKGVNSTNWERIEHLREAELERQVWGKPAFAFSGM